MAWLAPSSLGSVTRCENLFRSPGGGLAAAQAHEVDILRAQDMVLVARHTVGSRTRMGREEERRCGFVSFIDMTRAPRRPAQGPCGDARWMVASCMLYYIYVYTASVARPMRMPTCTRVSMHASELASKSASRRTALLSTSKTSVLPPNWK